MDFFTSKIASRLGGTNFDRNPDGYKFARIKKAREEACVLRPEIPLIDMGVGEPDIPADPAIVRILAEEAGKSRNRFYADNGILEFQEAAAAYMERVYGVGNLNPGENIMHGLGSKQILAILPSAFINPGDITLMTVPGYPIIGVNTVYLGGETYNLPLFRENSFYPDFSSIPDNVLKKAKLLYINYPNNPTGQAATKEFYSEVVEFAYKNGIVVVSDAAYGAITLDGRRPLSFLSVDGALEVGVEVHSLSKAFNMTGWRMAFIAGSEKAVKAYGAVKDNTDSGQFRAIQKAGAYALSHPEITELNRTRYSRRLDLLVGMLKEVGFHASKPGGTFYCYVPAPKGAEGGKTSFANAAEAAEYLIRKSLISVVPWDEAGAFLRFSATFGANGCGEERSVVDEVKRRLERLELVF